MIETLITPATYMNKQMYMKQATKQVEICASTWSRNVRPDSKQLRIASGYLQDKQPRWLHFNFSVSIKLLLSSHQLG